MALTGIEIFKKLPKTNCGKCGVPTCLAFAMKLAAGQAELGACPFVSEQAKAELDEASAPPIRPLTIGAGEKAFKTGGETVLFRHEKRFVSPTGIAVLISDQMAEAEIGGRLQRLKDLRYHRVGLTLEADLVAVKSDSGDPAKFEALVQKVKSQSDGKGLILMSENPQVLAAGAKACAGSRPLLYGATKANADAVIAIAKETSAPVAVKAGSLDELIELVNKLTAAGLKDLVLDSGSRTVREALNDQIVIRRSALLKKFRPFGFPTITFPCEMTSDPMQEVLLASLFIAKYGGIVVLSDLEGHGLFPLLLERMNLFTDPQRPDGHQRGHLRNRRTQRELSGSPLLQFLPHLLHRFRGNRGEPGSGLAADQGYGRAVRHDRVGRRKVRGGRHRPLREKMRDRRQGQASQAHCPRVCGGHQRRAGRRTAGLENPDRAPGGRAHPGVPEGLETGIKL